MRTPRGQNDTVSADLLDPSLSELTELLYTANLLPWALYYFLFFFYFFLFFYFLFFLFFYFFIFYFFLFLNFQ